MIIISLNNLCKDYLLPTISYITLTESRVRIQGHAMAESQSGVVRVLL